MSLPDTANSKFQKYKQAAASALRWDGQILASSHLTPDDRREEFPHVAGPAPRKPRGRNKSTIKLIEAMHEIAEKSHPITGRGIGYKLFVLALIPSMSKRDMGFVYRALVKARMDGTIPWHWVVDETWALELISTWNNPRECAAGFYYRRDLWRTQPIRVEVWSEKGTVRGVLEPVLDELGVGFRVMHGFASATSVWEAANRGNDGRPLIVLYIGDYDPSGMCMSEVDLPARIKEFGGDHIQFRRIALTEEQARPLPSFSVEEKKGDKRYAWFKKTYGDLCWELDAMDPVVLRDIVKSEIEALIDRPLWEQQEALQARERAALEGHLCSWASLQSRPVPAKSDLLITPTNSLFGLRGFRSNGWGVR